MSGSEMRSIDWNFSEEFDEVILTDIFFMQEAINEIKLYPNCRFEQLDISSVLKEAYYLWRNNKKNLDEFDSKLRNLMYRKPNHFLQEVNLDLVVSCNLLSQLSMAYENFAQRTKIPQTETLKNFLNSFQENHIEYLKTFPESTFIHLLTDTEKIVFNKEGKELEKDISVDPSLFKDFKEQDSWLWNLADYGEIEKNYALKLRVNSYTH